MKNNLFSEDAILDSGELVKKTAAAFIGNIGKIIAIFVAALTVAVTFTDVSFSGFLSDSFTTSVLLILTSGYIIYFSLEDAGEKYGMQTEEYVAARMAYDKQRERIVGEDMDALRSFLSDYADREFRSRRSCALISAGISERELEAYLSGKDYDRRKRRALRRISKIKPSHITPRTLLCRESRDKRSELENPESKKLPMLLAKLLPSTVCTFVTVAIVLTAKDGLGAADILNAILYLSALPVMAFRGYCEGYSFAKHSLSLWLEVKANILESFFEAANFTRK